MEHWVTHQQESETALPCWAFTCRASGALDPRTHLIEASPAFEDKACQELDCCNMIGRSSRLFFLISTLALIANSTAFGQNSKSVALPQPVPMPPPIVAPADKPYV